MRIGYEYLIDLYDLRVTGVLRPCRVDRRVNASVQDNAQLRIPLSMAVRTNNPVDHLEFALKHQGIQLEIIQAACKQIGPELIQAALSTRPNGKYLRQIGFLYEYFSGHEIQIQAISARYVKLFDDNAYVTGPSRLNGKYRIDQNGLGDLSFCPVVRRTAALESLLKRDLFADLQAFIEKVGGTQNLDRALGWAYLSETRSSFDIEGEAPSEDKAQRFVQLLHQAHNAQDLTEDYLAGIQSALVNNPYAQEQSYRRNQNWLQRGSRQLRATDVTYLPPAPAMLGTLMADLLQFANAPYPENSRESLLKSLLVSFQFVFNHPFNDGNGRISRFLIHHGLCRAHLLEQGMILPISVAFHRHEADYLTALESVSKPIRKLWHIHNLSVDTIDAHMIASGDPYRYWDGTLIAEFGLRMAHYALDHTLIDEFNFLAKFDQAYKIINNEFDVPGKDLNNLIRMAISENGTLSKRRRKQYALVVDAAVLDAIEDVVREVFFNETR